MTDPKDPQGDQFSSSPPGSSMTDSESSRREPEAPDGSQPDGHSAFTRYFDAGQLVVEQCLKPVDEEEGSYPPG
jgi:hypothetical protein